MARRAPIHCADPSCLHIAPPRVAADHAPLARLAALPDDDDDDDRLRLEQRRVVGAESPDLDASRAILTDCVLERCDLANSVWRRARLTRVAFVDCRLVGVTFGEDAQLVDVTFTGCMLDMASFDGASLSRVAVARSRAADATFRRTRLDAVAFPGTDLTRTEFSEALPQGAAALDLRGATLEGVTIDARLVRALVVRAEDLAIVARALGTTVREGDARPSCKR